MKRNYKKENETKEEAWETTEILDLFLDWNDGDGTEAWEERRGEREKKKKKNVKRLVYLFFLTENVRAAKGKNHR